MATFKEIATYTVTSSNTDQTIAFTNINSTYDHLAFWANTAATSGRTVYFEINGVSLSQYQKYIRYNGTTISAGAVQTNGAGYLVENADALNNPSVTWFDNYKNTALKKQYGTESSGKASGNMYLLHTAGSTNATTTISSITFRFYDGTYYFQPGSRITIYGISNS
jgi:hypothetical protein